MTAVTDTDTTQTELAQGTLTDVEADAGGYLRLADTSVLNFDPANYAQIDITGVVTGNQFTIEFISYPVENTADSLNYFLDASLGRFILATKNDVTGEGWSIYSGGSWVQLQTSVNWEVHQHIAIAFDGVNLEASLYIDGVHIATKTVASADIGGTVFIGRAYYSAVSLSGGRNSDIRFWNTVRSQTDIQNNMNKRLVGTETGLVAYYKLDEATGTVATDSAGSNDGTISGANWVLNKPPYFMNAAGNNGRLSPQLDLSTAGIVENSLINWTETLNSQTITIETRISTDNGVTWTAWAACTNGNAIPDLSSGTDISNGLLECRQLLSTSIPTTTPQLYSITVAVNVTTYQLEALEVFSFADTSLVGKVYYRVNSDTCLIYDVSKNGFHKQILESISIYDTQEYILAILMKETLFLTNPLTSTWKGVESAFSQLWMVDSAKFGKMFDEMLPESVSFADVSSFAWQLYVIDLVTCSSSAEATAKFQKQISEAMAVSDSAKKTWEKLISEVFNIVESSVLKPLFLKMIQESIAFSPGITPAYFFNKAIQESVLFSPEISSSAILGSLIQDSLGMSTIIELDGEVYECWILNTHKFHPSIYSGFDFNSYAIFKERAYGCKSDGIYELTGETDNEEVVHSGMALPETDFDTVKKKRFRKAFLGIAGDSPAIKVANESDYGIYGIQDDKAYVNRSLIGEQWTFSIMDFDELEFIELIPVVLTKRPQRN